MNRYFIKEGYQLNLSSDGKAIPYLDTVENADGYQYSVYLFARKTIRRFCLKSVLDIGCGYARKLADVIYPVCNDITGIDTEHSITFCRRKYNVGEWYTDDIEKSNLNLDRKFDLIISADVIEHLICPDMLMGYIKKFCHKKTYIILSTPERDLLRGEGDFGPPANPAHVREWNKDEFKLYLRSKGLFLFKHFIVSQYGKNLIQQIHYFFKNKRKINTCQVILGQISL